MPARTATCCRTPDSNQPTFDLDPAALEKRYKLLQWQLHPDKAVNRTPLEQQFSAEAATRVNQAYGVLRRPLSRANYMVRPARHRELVYLHIIKAHCSSIALACPAGFPCCHQHLVFRQRLD